MSEKNLTVDIWGHYSEEAGYKQAVQYPYEVDTPEGETGATYIRYLNRDNTVIHRIEVSQSDSRTSIVRTVGYGSWVQRESLDYLPPENYPRNVVVEFPDEESESESGNEPESGSEPASGSEPESGSESASGSESGSEPVPESGSESGTEPESGSEE